MLGGPAFSQPALDPVGTWLTGDGRAKIKLEHCTEGSEKLCGFVAWLKDPLDDDGQPRTDINNPDPAKRSRPSLGLPLLNGLKLDEDGRYAGEIYNADDGKMYSVTLAVETRTELHVRGCVMHILCGSQTWSRVADIALPGAAPKVVAAATPKAVKAAGVKPSH